MLQQFVVLQNFYWNETVSKQNVYLVHDLETSRWPNCHLVTLVILIAFVMLPHI